VEPKFHQVAMYCGSLKGMERAEARFEQMGFGDWTHDIARLVGTIRGEPAECVAYMAFNYDILPGIEYELLVYDGPTRWNGTGAYSMTPFISHISYHVEDLSSEVRRMTARYGHAVQAFETHDHTNDTIKGQRRFNEVIFDTREEFGHDIKLIQRLPWGAG
jgi:hypothetical protein